MKILHNVISCKFVFFIVIFTSLDRISKIDEKSVCVYLLNVPTICNNAMYFRQSLLAYSHGFNSPKKSKWINLEIILDEHLPNAQMAETRIRHCVQTPLHQKVSHFTSRSLAAIHTCNLPSIIFSIFSLSLSSHSSEWNPTHLYSYFSVHFPCLLSNPRDERPKHHAQFSGDKRATLTVTGFVTTTPPQSSLTSVVSQLSRLCLNTNCWTVKCDYFTNISRQCYTLQYVRLSGTIIPLNLMKDYWGFVKIIALYIFFYLSGRFENSKAIEVYVSVRGGGKLAGGPRYELKGLGWGKGLNCLIQTQQTTISPKGS